MQHCSRYSRAALQQVLACSTAAGTLVQHCSRYSRAAVTRVQHCSRYSRCDKAMMLHRYLRCAASLTAVVGQANEDEEENGSNDHDGDDNTCNRHASTPCYMLRTPTGFVMWTYDAYA